MSDQHLYDQNKDQYSKIHDNTHRISILEAEVQTLRTALIGIDGSNGIRGEFRSFRNDVLKKLDEMDKKRESARRWHWETLIAAAAVIVAAVALIL